MGRILNRRVAFQLLFMLTQRERNDNMLPAEELYGEYDLSICLEDDPDDDVGSWEVLEGEESEFLESVDDEDRAYIKNLVEQTWNLRAALDAFIEPFLRGWSLARLSGVDLASLRLAISGLLHEPEISERVIINEAVKQAKRYGNEDSHAFVNGVLASVANLDPDDLVERLKKAGIPDLLAERARLSLEEKA
ncbi:MAG: transcription antitermination factor NusB [Clostridiaceae bacterium]|nr:transcription antitermination factor NusB [Clostridiaceae bacterium]